MAEEALIRIDEAEDVARSLRHALNAATLVEAEAQVTATGEALGA